MLTFRATLDTFISTVWLFISGDSGMLQWPVTIIVIGFMGIAICVSHFVSHWRGDLGRCYKPVQSSIYSWPVHRSIGRPI